MIFTFVVEFHLNCDFENQDTCMYDQNIAGDFEWTLHLGGSQSALTGPVFDHTKFNAEGEDIIIIWSTNFP